jgi:DNA (cytosine-5)-methyltransferase 1
LNEPYRVLDLFSGVGGFSLGLERTGGFRTVAFCEIEPYCRAVLRKHWPDVPCYEDVRTLTAERLAADGISVDVIAGGFPCQDLSRANGVWSSRPGLDGERSGLWHEYARLIRELRPRYIIVENVPDLLDEGLGTILGDLAESGFDAEWDCLPATVFGARHPRERIWLVSYPGGERLDGKHRQGQQARHSGGVFDAVARSKPRPASAADWVSEPAIPRVVDGVPNRMERIARTRAIGNAVVPQIPEIIGRAILQAEGRLT